MAAKTNSFTDKKNCYQIFSPVFVFRFGCLKTDEHEDDKSETRTFAAVAISWIKKMTDI